LSGDAAAADANGRTALLIHGGAGGAAPTDGSIRVPDEAMASLLKVLPANPAAAKPRITVRVQQAADDSRPQAWRTRPASLATADARHWRASGGYPSSIRRSATWQSPYYSDDGFWFAYYQQMYLFDLLNQAPYDQRCTPGDYYPYVDPGCEPAPAADPDGAAAANALSALGYDVGQQPQDPQPAVQTGAAPAPSGQPDAGVTAPDTAPVGQDIGHDRSVGPLEALQQASDTSSWIPDGGAYGR